MQKYRDTVLDSSGNIVIGAIVTAVLAGGGAATIYSDNGLTVVTQVVSGADGSFFFYAANGRYTITVTPPVSTGLPSVTVTDILLEDLTPVGTLSASQIANTPAGTIAATNVQAALNELDTEKALLAGSASQTFSVAAATAAAHAVPLSQLADGWVFDTNTWTYASASTFTVPGNQTGLYVTGLKIKWTDSGGVKYGVVASSAFGTSTTVTILVNTSYVIANSAITLPSFSFGANPVGFPRSFTFAVSVAAVTPGGTPPTWSSYAGNYYTIGRRMFLTLYVGVNVAGTGSDGISFGNLPISVVINQTSGYAKENAVAGISGILICGTNVINLQTYAGGNPIINSYAWLCDINTFF